VLPQFSNVRRLAQGVLQRCGITKPPVDLRLVARHFGLDYREVAYLPDSVEAAIYPHLPGEPLAAIVNKNLLQTYCRFTLAHQLFHLEFDHYPYVIESSIRLIELPLDYSFQSRERMLESILNRIIGKNKHELRADIFAIELLLPPSILQKQLQLGLPNTDVHIEYAVSEDVATFAMSRQYKTFF
jgi:hypothetical protein